MSANPPRLRYISPSIGAMAVADELTSQGGFGVLVPRFHEGDDWRRWANDMAITSGAQLSVPDPKHFSGFEAWAETFFRANAA